MIIKKFVLNLFTKYILVITLVSQEKSFLIFLLEIQIYANTYFEIYNILSLTLQIDNNEISLCIFIIVLSYIFIKF